MMKLNAILIKVCCLLLLLLCQADPGLAQTSDKGSRYELGATFGSPFAQPLFGFRLKERQWLRFSGLTAGIQLAFSHELKKSRVVSWNIEGVAGRTSGLNSVELLFGGHEGTWSYTGLLSSVNLRGAYVSAGVVWGFGRQDGAHLLGQIGYVHRFGK